MNSRYGSFEMQRMRIPMQKDCQNIDFTDVCRLSIVDHLSVAKAVFGPGPDPRVLRIFGSSTTEDDSG